MIYEHEIPNGSRLYFGKLAKIKRKLEDKVSSFLCEKGFFSFRWLYHSVPCNFTFNLLAFFTAIH